MATISRRLESAFGDLSWNYNIFQHSRTAYNTVPYRYSIEISLTSKILEFPMLYKNTVISTLIENKECKKLVIDLSNILYSDMVTTVKTADTMICKFFTGGSNARLFKFANAKGDIYYGHNGIILDKDFKVLMCLFVRLQWDKETSSGTLLQPVLKINPWVFNNQQEFMSKAIIQKIIPLSLKGVYISSIEPRVNTSTFPRYQIKVDDFKEFITTPTPPHFSENINNELNQTLIDNMSDLNSLLQ